MNDNINGTCLKALGLGARARNGLATIGVFTLEQLEQKTETQVLCTHNIGRATLREIRSALQNAGKTFKERSVEQSTLELSVNRRHILDLARKAGFPTTRHLSGRYDIAGQAVSRFERFAALVAALVAAAEREECATACEEFYSVEFIAQECAAAIRARGQQ
jgi:hypothetical protein